MPLFVERKERIPADFPEKAVGVGEVAAVAAPEDPAGRLHQPGTSRHGLGQQAVGIRFRSDVVRQRETGKTAAG